MIYARGGGLGGLRYRATGVSTNSGRPLPSAAIAKMPVIGAVAGSMVIPPTGPGDTPLQLKAPMTHPENLGDNFGKRPDFASESPEEHPHGDRLTTFGFWQQQCLRHISAVRQPHPWFLHGKSSLSFTLPVGTGIPVVTSRMERLLSVLTKRCRMPFMADGQCRLRHDLYQGPHHSHRLTAMAVSI